MSSSSTSPASTGVEVAGEPPPATTGQSKPRIFYGWYIVAITFAGTFFATGIHDTVFSIMMEPISSDTGWSRTQISLPISLSIWIGSLAGPFIGRYVDKRGPRGLTSLGSVILGIVYFLLSMMNQFWQFFLIYPAGRMTSQAVMLGNVPSTTISNWFVRRRGRAVGIQAMANGLAGAILALVATLIINQWGWRAAYVVFGICMWLVAVPAFLMLRHRPEEMGLLPDGDTPEEAARAKAELGAHGGHGHGHGHGHGARRRGQPLYRTTHDFGVKEALKTKTLWALIAVSTISSTGTGALNLHVAPYLRDVGISSSTTALIVGLTALMGAMGSLIWGFLAERVTPRSGIFLVYSAAAVAVFLLAYFGSIGVAFAFAFIYGIVTRGGRVVLTLATADYYGRTNLGTIQGMVIPVQTAGLGIGQIAAPLIQGETGSYALAFYILAAMYVVAALIGLTVRPPKAPPSVVASTGD